MKLIFKYPLVLLLLFAGLENTAQSGGPVSTAYHNTTAHYNAFFIANEKMLEIETQLYDNYSWNYNKILPIFPQFDSTFSQTVNALTEDCIEKASISITRHEGSRWEDDAYVLVGKARFYACEFPDAIETFKYVNKKGRDDDARHEALIQLIKAFVEFEELNNAIAVSDFLKKEDLNNKNLFNLYLSRAYLYQKQKDKDQTVRNLVLAEALIPHIEDKARIQFIIGQIYQDLGLEPDAYKYYEKSLKSRPSYELSFYTKLNMAQVTQLGKSNDAKRIRKYFKKLLRDPKNLEYKDKIYYEMASFEQKNGDLVAAIEFYRQSAQSSIQNERQKAYAYWRLGEIYYDSLKNFPLAKSYYDSTIQVMPKDEEDYETILQRQEILSEFVEQITIIEQNDSLIALSYLPEDSARSIATLEVERAFEEERERKKREKEAAKRAQRQATTAFDTQGGNLITAGFGSQEVWYFDNPSALSRGSSEFKRIWGNRVLEDNWRRSSKAGAATDAKLDQSEATAVEEKPAENIEAELEDQVNQLLQDIPRTDEAMAELLSEIEDALYRLGNIYNFNLEEKQNAVNTFEQLLTRFQESEYRPEVLYQLYLLYNFLKEPDLATIKAEELKSKFPKTIYAKLIDNPNYREESNLATIQLKIAYSQAYSLYKREMYKASRYVLDSALSIHPENEYSDNLKLLDVLAMGKLEGRLKYQYELNEFIKNYPESDLLDHANKLLAASENYQINMYNSAKASFIDYFDQTHYLVITYPSSDELSEAISDEVSEFLATHDYENTSGNLILDETKALILINDVPGYSEAQEMLNQLKVFDLPNRHKGEKIHIFAITLDNFNIFYQTKDLDAYLNFFDRKYQ